MQLWLFVRVVSGGACLTACMHACRADRPGRFRKQTPCTPVTANAKQQGPVALRVKPAEGATQLGGVRTAVPLLGKGSVQLSGTPLQAPLLCVSPMVRVERTC